MSDETEIPAAALPAPEPAPAPEPLGSPAPPAIPDLDKIGSPKTATFVCVQRVRAAEYADAIFDALRRQFLVPAAPSKATAYRLGGVTLTAFAFPTAPGFIEYDALVAYLDRALDPA